MHQIPSLPYCSVSWLCLHTHTCLFLFLNSGCDHVAVCSRACHLIYLLLLLKAQNNLSQEHRRDVADRGLWRSKSSITVQEISAHADTQQGFFSSLLISSWWVVETSSVELLMVLISCWGCWTTCSHFQRCMCCIFIMTHRSGYLEQKRTVLRSSVIRSDVISNYDNMSQCAGCH